MSDCEQGILELAPSTEVLFVRYPRHLEATAEHDSEQLAAVADSICDDLATHIEGPTVLFGQGFGAWMAYEVAHRLEMTPLPAERAMAEVAALVVSSQPAPSCRTGGPGPVLACPIGVFLGDTDPRTTYDEAAAWARHGANRFDLHLLHGGRGYFQERPKEIINALSDYMLTLSFH
ncbi:thioesterase II family protein [Streptomyces kanamyceticus]|nr:thioesterase domain-containing protein [Streptomyces kanamyceticus]